jgi:hypothetical protein
LVIGNPKKIMKIRSVIADELHFEKDIDINLLFEIIDSNEQLIILAHPFRNHGHSPKLNRKITDKFDAVELNAGDLHDDGIEDTKSKVSRLSKELNLPIVCGSDTHYFISMGCVKNIFNNCNTISELKQQIHSRNFNSELSDDLLVRVRRAGIVKKIILA